MKVSIRKTSAPDMYFALEAMTGLAQGARNTGSGR